MIIHWNSKLAKAILPKKFIAITFGKHIFIKKRLEDFSKISKEKLIKHESKHVEQYKLYGFFGFLIRYLWYHIRFGYEENPFEVKAKKAEVAKNRMY